jgi:hypothetical protein
MCLAAVVHPEGFPGSLPRTHEPPNEPLQRFRLVHALSPGPARSPGSGGASPHPAGAYDEVFGPSYRIFSLPCTLLSLPFGSRARLNVRCAGTVSPTSSNKKASNRPSPGSTASNLFSASDSLPICDARRSNYLPPQDLCSRGTREPRSIPSSTLPRTEAMVVLRHIAITLSLSVRSEDE